MKEYIKIYLRQDYRLFQKIVFFLGIMGLIGHLLFYYVLKEVFGMWESFPLRAVTALLYFSFVTLPRKGTFNKYQIIYIELVLALTLPLMFNLYAFQNNFNTYWSTGIVWAAFVYGILANPSRSIILYPLSYAASVFIVEFVMHHEVLREEYIKSLQLNFQAYFIMFLVSVFQSIINHAYTIIDSERQRSDGLLENILPAPIISRLKDDKTVIADYFPNSSIVFIDIQNFTSYSSTVGPDKVVWMLNDIFSRLDGVLKKHGLEKIKTIGDCYMAASGLPEPSSNHASKAALFAQEAMRALKNYTTDDGVKISFRCGIDCGPVVAGVIGEHKFIYDVWGDAVNTASRMEHHSESDRIHVTQCFRDAVGREQSAASFSTDAYDFTMRGQIDVKGKGVIVTHYLEF